MPRDTGECKETFFVVTTGKGDGTGIQWEELVKDSASCLTMCKTVSRPLTKNIWPTNVSSAEVEKLWFKGDDFHQ